MAVLLTGPRVSIASAQTLVRTATQSFAGSLDRLDSQCRPSPSAFLEARRLFHQFADELFACLAEVEQSCGDTQELAALRKEFRGAPEIGPFYEHEFNRWALAKPLGYAGDYRTLDLIYAHEPIEGGITGCIDAYYYELEAVRSVVRRRAHLAAEIRATVRRTAGRATIVSLGCGSAPEVADAAQELVERGTRVVLVDTEERALARAHDVLQSAAPDLPVEYRCENLMDYLRALRADASFDLARLYGRSADLVYAVGVMDYMGTRAFAALVPVLSRCLTPEGRCILGNFDPCNGSRAYMEWLLDWPLHYRSARELQDLVEGAGGRDARVERGGTEVNNFVSFRRGR